MVVPTATVIPPKRKNALSVEVTDLTYRFEPPSIVGNPECAGLNRHVVGDARALQERK